MSLLTKSVSRENGIMHVEYRHGVAGNGNTRHIIISYYGNGYNRTYHEESFNNGNEALNWYNNIS